jgi:hypothetical protein
MNKKILIINVPLYNLEREADYGKVVVNEVEDFQKDGWTLEKITPVVPNQPGNTALTNIQYLVQFTK